MNWFWDNIRLKKEERLGMFVFILIVFVLLLVKYYLVIIYTPKGEIDNIDFYEKIEYSIIEPTQVESKASRPSSISRPKKKNVIKKKFDSKVATNEIKKKRPKFDFDPNTISIDSLILLGISKYAANNISKYRSKGGRFKQSNDLQKVYGLDSLTFRDIHSFIKIKKINQKSGSRKYTSTGPKYIRPIIALKSIDINKADTTEFKKLRGIGSVYAKRIVKFRHSLGGYFSIEQIKDVWGISDSLFTTLKPYLKIDQSLIKKKNINSLPKEILVKHPYVDWKKAKVILKYKQMHGSYKSMDDFEKLHGIQKEFIDTLRHYFVTQ